MKDYKPVPVSAARDVANSFDKDVVVIIAYDNAHNLTNTTTYGRDALDKIRAADLGEILAKAAGCDMGKADFSEDFRQPALRAQRIDELLAAAEELVKSDGDCAYARLKNAIASYKSGQ